MPSCAGILYASLPANFPDRYKYASLSCSFNIVTISSCSFSCATSKAVLPSVFLSVRPAPLQTQWSVITGWQCLLHKCKAQHARSLTMRRVRCPGCAGARNQGTTQEQAVKLHAGQLPANSSCAKHAQQENSCHAPPNNKSALLQQRLDARQLPIPCCVMQRCVLVIIDSRHAGTMLEQVLDDVGLAVAARVVQCCVASGVLLINAEICTRVTRL